MDFKIYARQMFERGWVGLPLRLDGKGIPKVPIDPGWQTTPLDWGRIEALSWSQARGVGVLLGEPSGGLGCLDIDDVELHQVLASLIHGSGMYVATASGRGHIYFRVKKTLPTRKISPIWRGSARSIELRGANSQCAFPPTPGYSFILGPGDGPFRAETLDAGLDTLSKLLLHTRGEGLEGVRGDSSFGPGGGSGVRAWTDRVSEGDRNKTLFLEACFLKDARVPVGLAERLLEIRVREDYEPGMTQNEFVSTIRSAYRRDFKGNTKQFKGGYDV